MSKPRIHSQLPAKAPKRVKIVTSIISKKSAAGVTKTTITIESQTVPINKIKSKKLSKTAMPPMLPVPQALAKAASATTVETTKMRARGTPVETMRMVEIIRGVVGVAAEVVGVAAVAAVVAVGEAVALREGCRRRRTRRLRPINRATTRRPVKGRPVKPAVSIIIMLVKMPVRAAARAKVSSREGVRGITTSRNSSKHSRVPTMSNRATTAAPVEQKMFAAIIN